MINRYTASGAYLLSSYKSHEERETIWQEACGKKTTASIRELRAVLKKRQERDPLSTATAQQSAPHYQMAEIEIHEAFIKLSQEAKKLRYSSEPQRLEQRRRLIRATRELLRQMEAQL